MIFDTSFRLVAFWGDVGLSEYFALLLAHKED
jgi:hypothetical protein